MSSRVGGKKVAATIVKRVVNHIDNSITYMPLASKKAIGEAVQKLLLHAYVIPRPELGAYSFDTIRAHISSQHYHPCRL